MCGRYVQTMPADSMRELFRMAIAPRSGEAMAFAGLWENWRGEGGEVLTWQEERPGP